MYLYYMGFLNSKSIVLKGINFVCFISDVLDRNNTNPTWFLFSFGSKEFVDMLTTCSMRIGDAGSKRLAVLFLNSSGASKRISVDDSVNALGQLCCMLYKANLFTARDVVITYIEKRMYVPLSFQMEFASLMHFL